MTAAPAALAALTVLTALAAVADWFAVARQRRRVEVWVKPATTLLLAATAVAAGALEEPAGGWLVAAVLLGVVGDVALLDEEDGRRFVGGVAAFLLGHLAYVVCFLELGVGESWWLVGGAAVVVVAFVVGRDVLPGALQAEGPGLTAAVAVYMAVIGAMTVTGWATAQPLVAVGTATFVASDLTLAMAKFVRPWRGSHLTVMVTYHLGQALIVAGVLLAL